MNLQEQIDSKLKEWPPKIILKRLEKKGVYLFHGSNYLSSKLEPRRSKGAGWHLRRILKRVSASPFCDYAIFFAIMPRNVTGRTRAELINNKLEFYATKEQLENMQEGYVHIVLSRSFKPWTSTERVSKKPVEVLAKIKVSKKDFSSEIHLIE